LFKKISVKLILPTARHTLLAVGLFASLAILETTDLHAHILGFDYFRLSEDPSSGLDKTSTLIHQARAKFSNTLLVDAGDMAWYQVQLER
jgi:2',3'-cyclic-nucleotide 2'-phosphodiesterase/3'-nucleotidase